MAESSAFSRTTDTTLGGHEQDFLPHCPSAMWAAVCIVNGRGRQEADESIKCGQVTRNKK